MNGQYIRSLRATLGLSIKEMADLLAVDKSVVYRWEASRGQLPPIGLAQRQLLLLIGLPGPVDARRIRAAMKDAGRLAVWAYLTRGHLPDRARRTA